MAEVNLSGNNGGKNSALLNRIITIITAKLVRQDKIHDYQSAAEFAENYVKKYNLIFPNDLMEDGIAKETTATKILLLRDTLYRDPIMSFATEPFSVEKEYSKDPKLKKEQIENLSEWAKKQPHFPPMRDHWLVLILHSCYYSMEGAKKCLENFFNLKTHSPELFGKRDTQSPEIELVWKQIDTVLLPKKTSEGYRVYFGRLCDSDSSHFDWSTAMKTYIMNLHIQLIEEGTSEGYIFVFDMAKLSLGHVARLNFSIVKKFLMFVQEANPIRMKQIHVLNTHSVIEKLMFLIKPVMGKDLLNLITFHPGIPKEFLDKVPLSILPKDLGGDEISIAELKVSSIAKLKANQNFFDIDEHYIIDESKRTGKVVNEGTLYGVEGSFKKLELD